VMQMASLFSLFKIFRIKQSHSIFCYFLCLSLFSIQGEGNEEKLCSLELMDFKLSCL
jgi:hypothetical protein